MANKRINNLETLVTGSDLSDRYIILDKSGDLEASKFRLKEGFVDKVSLQKTQLDDIADDIQNIENELSGTILIKRSYNVIFNDTITVNESSRVWEEQITTIPGFVYGDYSKVYLSKFNYTNTDNFQLSPLFSILSDGTVSIAVSGRNFATTNDQTTTFEVILNCIEYENY